LDNKVIVLHLFKWRLRNFGPSALWRLKFV